MQFKAVSKLMLVVVGLAFTSASMAAKSARGSSAASAHRGGASIPLDLTVAPSILIAGAAVPGVNLSFASRLVDEVPIHFVGETGPYLYTGGYGTAYMMPFLLGAEYRIDLEKTRVRPLIGMVMGAAVGITGGGVAFMMMFRPGLDIPLKNSKVLINFEPRLGVLGGAFVFAPQLGAKFTL